MGEHPGNVRPCPGDDHGRALPLQLVDEGFKRVGAGGIEKGYGGQVEDEDARRVADPVEDSADGRSRTEEERPV